MSESLRGTPMTTFHTWYGVCEGVGWDLGYVMGGGGGGWGSHFMHDINHSMCEL